MKKIKKQKKWKYPVRLFLFFASISSLAIGFSVSASSAFAHAGVQQKEVGIGSIQTFTFGVPNEKEDASTTGVRIVIPEGVEDIMPNVEPGWNINVKRETITGEEKITEISWTGGDIPPGQRGEVSLTAQAPSEEKTIVWKAYQTYSDGESVAWDKSPEEVAKYQKEIQASGGTTGHDDTSAPKPYSTTRVINDLKASPSPAAQTNSGNTTVAGSQGNNIPLILSILAMILSVGSIGLQFYKNKKQK